MSGAKWDDIDITREEMNIFSEAFKKEEFRKLFIEYCEELNNPENKKQFEEEITQLEAERGVDVTFIKPEPGFVIKTSVDGKSKAFINVSKSDKVAKPTSTSMIDPTGQKGLNWSLPYTQAPPRKDVDKKGALCVVYDVVFHPDTLYLAEKNSRFRNIVIDTACDAVQSAFSVEIDKNNLKFPKMAFKGTSRPTIIRKKSENPPQDIEPSPLDKIYPPMPSENSEVKTVKPKVATNVSSYAIPKYTITHRRDVDFHEFTDELDSKMNLTVPKELVVGINLPLLNSTNDVTLDVTAKEIYLISEKPSKYKLQIKLPYPVDEKNGTAKFDKATRKLLITLPVVRETKSKLFDLYREDSGVESDHGCSPKDELFSNESNSGDDERSLEFDNPSKNDENDNDTIRETKIKNEEPKKFLDDSICYSLPAYNCNVLCNTLAFTLHVKNVDSETIEVIRNKVENSVHIKFSSVGSGYFPVYYAFFVKLNDIDENSIKNVIAEAWDNNLILQLEVNCDVNSYLAGLNEANLTEYPIEGEIIPVKPEPLNTKEQIEDNALSIEVKMVSEEEVCIEVASKVSTPAEEKPKKQNNKKKMKKVRSLSESCCDDLKDAIAEHELSQKVSNKEQTTDEEVKDRKNLKQIRKTRSLSESNNNNNNSNNSVMNEAAQKYKSILKRRVYDRSISESSVDDHSLTGSLDFYIGSFDGIPEENQDMENMSESCKKTVRFNDVIHKQLFRHNSSILGQRRKNQKKKNKKRDRRHSESENSEYDEKDKIEHKSLKNTRKNISDGDNNNKLERRDSGFVSQDKYNGNDEDDDNIIIRKITKEIDCLKDCTIDKNISDVVAAAEKLNLLRKAEEEIDFKNGMIFDLEI